MSRFLNVLRSWLVMVSIIAMGNTVQSFRDHSFLSEKLYTGKPNLVNGLQARTFGIWTLLSSVIRCYCAIDIRNQTNSALSVLYVHFIGNVKGSNRSLDPLQHHTFDLLHCTGSLPLGGIYLWHSSCNNWCPGPTHGGKFLYFGYADWAAISGSGRNISAQETELKLQVPSAYDPSPTSHFQVSATTSSPYLVL